jgi:hypothetical protein
MQYSAYSFFSDHTEPEDDIDKIFNKLQPIEPSPDLITRILDAILALTQPLSDFDLDGLVVRNETNEPS